MQPKEAWEAFPALPAFSHRKVKLLGQPQSRPSPHNTGHSSCLLLADVPQTCGAATTEERGKSAAYPAFSCAVRGVCVCTRVCRASPGVTEH